MKRWPPHQPCVVLDESLYRSPGPSVATIPRSATRRIHRGAIRARAGAAGQAAGTATPMATLHGCLATRRSCIGSLFRAGTVICVDSPVECAGVARAIGASDDACRYRGPAATAVAGTTPSRHHAGEGHFLSIPHPAQPASDPSPRRRSGATGLVLVAIAVIRSGLDRNRRPAAVRIGRGVARPLPHAFLLGPEQLAEVLDRDLRAGR